MKYLLLYLKLPTVKLDPKQGSQTQIAPRAKLGLILLEGRIMTLTQQWRYPNLNRNSFYSTSYYL